MDRVDVVRDDYHLHFCSRFSPSACRLSLADLRLSSVAMAAPAPPPSTVAGPSPVAVDPPIACRKIFLIASGWRYEHFGLVRSFVDDEMALSSFVKRDLRQSLVKDPSVHVGFGENGTTARTACCVFGQAGFSHIVVSIIEELLTDVDLEGVVVWCNKGFQRV